MLRKMAAASRIMETARVECLAGNVCSWFVQIASLFARNNHRRAAGFNVTNPKPLIRCRLDGNEDDECGQL